MYITIQRLEPVICILLVIQTRCATYESGSTNDSLLTKLQFELTTPFQTLRKLDLIAVVFGN